FHREGFRYTPPEATNAPPQPASNPPPDLVPAASSPLPLAPTVLPTPIPIATPLPPAPVIFGPTPTATPNIRPAYEEPLFHEGVFNLLPGSVATAVMAYNTLPAGTPTSIPPAIPTAAPDTVWPALLSQVAVQPVAFTPTPTPVSVMPAPTTLLPAPTIVFSTVTNEVDIEDPRFYRGSFTIAPSGSVQAGAPAAGSTAGGGGVTGTSTGLSSYYSGSSYETLNPSYADRSPLPISGKAMYYNPGIMQEVYAYRLSLGEIQPCSECIGYVALLRKGDLGRRVYLRWADGTVEGPFLVIDVAASHHIGLLLQRGWAVDVDYQTAMRRKMYSPVPVTILDAPTTGYFD
ncbi:MAG TPA: hypothetical protein VNK95_09810, partial [Caldilineaceae bacterium]|nr:hypothetical protein [Caldilineaceae bacterium]